MEPGPVQGDSDFILLRKILSALRFSAGLPDEAQYSFRFGDEYYDILVKILRVAQIDAGLPGSADNYFRPGDTELALLRKILHVFSPADATCHCGFDEFGYYQLILAALTTNPADPEFSFRPGDNLNDLLRKILNNLAV